MPFNDNLLTIVPMCEGGFCLSHLPAIESVANQVAATPLVELALGGYFHDGLLRAGLDSLYREGKIATLIENTSDTPQGAVERALTVSARTPYLLFLDIHTALNQGGIGRLLDFIERCSPITVAGFPIQQPWRFDLRCVLVNSTFLRSLGTYQRPLAHQASRPLELLQWHLSVNSDVGSPWHPPMQKAFVLGSQTLESAESSDSKNNATSSKRVTVCVCAYGETYPFLSRCLESLLQEPGFAEQASLIVGCNAVDQASLDLLRSLSHSGTPLTVVLSRDNLNKDPMRRMMVTLANTTYLVSCDEDICLKPGWLRQICTFLSELPDPGADAAGCTLVSKYHTLDELATDSSIPYSVYPIRKSWWRWKRPPEGPDILFPGGGFHLMRNDFIRMNDYPDFRMLIDFDDILLGDLIVQVDGTYRRFPRELYEKVIVGLNSSRGERHKG